MLVRPGEGDFAYYLQGQNLDCVSNKTCTGLPTLLMSAMYCERSMGCFALNAGNGLAKWVTNHREEDSRLYIDSQALSIMSLELEVLTADA